MFLLLKPLLAIAMNIIHNKSGDPCTLVNKSLNIQPVLLGESEGWTKIDTRTSLELLKDC